jgi:hypothetical protein
MQPTNLEARIASLITGMRCPKYDPQIEMAIVSNRHYDQMMAVIGTATQTTNSGIVRTGE